MACKYCARQNQLHVNAELSLTSATLQSVLSNSPVYVTQKVEVCLDCGSIELKIPKSMLPVLKLGRAA